MAKMPCLAPLWVGLSECLVAPRSAVLSGPPSRGGRKCPRDSKCITSTDAADDQGLSPTLKQVRRRSDGGEQPARFAMVAALEMIEKLLERELATIDRLRLRPA